MEELIKRVIEQEQKNTGALLVHESQNLALRKDLDQLGRRMENIEACVHRIEVLQAGRAALPQCSAPNLCVELKEHVEKLADTVQTLVEHRAEARGARKTMIAIGAAFGGIGGALVTAVIHFFTSAKTP